MNILLEAEKKKEANNTEKAEYQRLTEGYPRNPKMSPELKAWGTLKGGGDCDMVKCPDSLPIPTPLCYNSSPQDSSFIL